MSLKPPLKPAEPPKAIIGQEGWGKPAGSNLRHYIRGQRSLCRQWGYYGNVSTDQSGAELCERCRDLHANATLKSSP